MAQRECCWSGTPSRIRHKIYNFSIKLHKNRLLYSSWCIFCVYVCMPGSIVVPLALPSVATKSSSTLWIKYRAISSSFSFTSIRQVNCTRNQCCKRKKKYGLSIHKVFDSFKYDFLWKGKGFIRDCKETAPPFHIHIYFIFFVGGMEWWSHWSGVGRKVEENQNKKKIRKPTEFWMARKVNA